MSNRRLSSGEDFIPRAEIAERTRELGRFYTERYNGEPVVVIALISGAVRFAVHLTEAIDNPEIIETYYRTKKMNGVRSHGKVALSGAPDIDIAGMNTLVIEDIDHTRETLLAVGERFRGNQPKRLDLVCLLNNVDAPKFPGNLTDFFDDVQYGFPIADRYVVGHGLDWNGHYRHLPHVSVAVNIAEPGQPEIMVPLVPNEFEPTRMSY